MDTLSTEHLSDLDTTDHYTEALHELITARAEHRTPRPVEAEPATAPVIDLMAALEASVAEAKQRRGETPAGGDGRDATVHEMPAPKKTAKKAPAKKTADKKTAARRRKSA